MKILFICTHNRCRSVLSEAIVNHIAGATILAKSAGSEPAGQVHPLTLKYLAAAGYSTTGLQSQSWDDFEQFEPGVVITVCDAAAGEACPVYFSRSLKVHWGLPDPSKVSESEEQQKRAFEEVISEVERRAHALNAIAKADLEGDALRVALNKLGAQ
ncbi:arsenate reductase ArsC [Salinimonas chungwhensis]|uniref:arsenate reductase ArsC n=1 Tax=Salinimonas chungwhensis TaxID=265425 RepID=UPI0003758B0A|nr:arsenate reductase ArsC [Salinimonas chungwhensis]